jgi:hypothetical protein
MPTFGSVVTQTELSGGGTLIINGTRPPTDTDGAVGDYWLDTAGKTLYGPKNSGGVYGPEQPALPGTPSTFANGGGSTYGTVMKSLVQGRIGSLRYYRAPGQAAHTATLLLYRQSNQTELGRVAISNSASAAAGWVTGVLPTPLDVTANTDLRVAYFMIPTSTQIGYAGPFTYSSLIPTLVSVVGSCNASGSPAYPGSDAGTICYFADILFQPLQPTWPIAIKSAP